MKDNTILDIQLEPELQEQLLTDAAQRSIRYRRLLDSRGVAPTPDAVRALSRFDEPLAEESEDPRKVLAMLDEVGSPATMAIAGSRFFGFVIGGSQPVTVGANWLASAWNQNAGLFLASPVTARLEEVALRWLLEIFRLPDDCGGAFLTGATMANFTCLAAARHSVMKETGWDVESDGLFGAPPVTVVVGAEAHPTLIKSLGLLGLGRNRVLTLPVDGQGRIDARNLPAIPRPAIVCVQVGNVNTGAIDPVREIIPWARKHGAWIHVDGAFGLWAAASPTLEHLTRGVEEADSWATDAHKWLNVPYDSGLSFVRNSETLRKAMTLTAAYLPVTEHREPSHYTPELSRRARGVEVWTALRTLGKQGLREMIERACRLARRFADGLSSSGCDVLNEVVLNQVLVSFGNPELTNRIISEIQNDGTCWCGGTVWQGKTAMRISVSSWATTDRDIDRSLDAMLRIAERERKRST
jgi:glutamate/tyrosine decarboxylase-like PLP-dependent enzyme